MELFFLPVSQCWFDASPEDDIKRIMTVAEGIEWPVVVHHEGGLDPDYCQPVLTIDRYFKPQRLMFVFDSFGPALAEYLFEGQAFYGSRMTKFAGYAIRSSVCRDKTKLHHRFQFIKAVPRKKTWLFKLKTQPPSHLEEQDFRELFEKPCVEYYEKISANPEYPSQVESGEKYKRLKEQAAA